MKQEAHWLKTMGSSLVQKKYGMLCIRKPDTWECMLGMEGIEYQIHQTEKLQ